MVYITLFGIQIYRIFPYRVQLSSTVLVAQDSVSTSVKNKAGFQLHVTITSQFAVSCISSSFVLVFSPYTYLIHSITICLAREHQRAS